MPKSLLTTKEAAKYLGQQPSTRRSWRCAKTGRPYIDLGQRNIRYAEDDLAAYVAARKVEHYAFGGGGR